MPAWFLFPVKLWYVWLILAVAAWSLRLLAQDLAGRWFRLAQLVMRRPRLLLGLDRGLKCAAYVAIVLVVFAFAVIGANVLAHAMAETFSGLSQF
jgi:hypothetical protein